MIRSLLRRQRHWVLFFWLCLPIFFAAFHYGSGKKWHQRDRAINLVSQANQADAKSAALLYSQATRCLNPDTQAYDLAIVRLRKIQAISQSANLHTITTELDTLARRARAEAAQDARWRNIEYEARQYLIQAQYDLAWILRTRGYPRKNWIRELNVARQNCRLILEEEQGNNLPTQHNLEACLWLERVDLDKLKGLDLPQNQNGDAPPAAGEEDPDGDSQRGKTPDDADKPTDGRSNGRNKVNHKGS